MLSHRKFIAYTLSILAVSIMSGYAAHADQAIAGQQAANQAMAFRGEEKLSRIVKKADSENWRKLPIGELMGKIAAELEGTTYVAGTLELSVDAESCNANLDALDCVTFVETTLALARTLKKGGHTPADLLQEIQLIRYRGGKLSDYVSRLHYTSDWIADNEAKHIVQPLSKLPGAENFAKKINFMTSNPSYYKQLAAHPELIERMKTQESIINKRTLKFVPMNKIAAVEPLLKTGDIVGITTSMPGLDITHTGLVIRDAAGTPHFMDASSKKTVMKVILEPGSISQKLLQSQKQSPNLTGVMFARPLEPQNVSAPTSTKQLLNDAQSAIKRRNFPEAYHKYTQLLNSDPNNIQARMYRADTLISLEKFDDALKDVDIILSKHPRNAEAFMTRGDCYIELGNRRLDRSYFDLAVKEFTKAISLDPKNATAFNNRGLCFHMNGHFQQALSDYKTACRLEPTEAKFVKNCAGLFVQLGDFQQAKAECLKALSIQPKNFYRYYDLGRLHLSHGDAKQAIEYLNKCLQYHPSFADGYVHRGLAYFDLEEFPRAISDFSIAISKNTKQKSVYRFRGLAFMRTGDKIRAQRDLDHYADEEVSSAHFEAGLEGALKKQGRDTIDGLIAKGIKAEESKDLDKAIQHYSLAIKQDRHNTASYKFRGHAYEAKGDFKKALGDYDVVLWIEPFDADTLAKRASIHEKLGQTDKALWDLNRAISADPVSSDAFFQKASLCLKLGKTKDAQTAYRRFIKVALLSTDKGNDAKLQIAMKALAKAKN